VRRRSGWPILVGGAVSILCGWLYSSGPRPIAATPFGELFVLVFFGFFAVGGAYWLAIGRLDAVALVAGAALGLFAAAVLLVNNHRDRVEDVCKGRRTLAIVLGPRATGSVSRASASSSIAHSRRHAIFGRVGNRPSARARSSRMSVREASRTWMALCRRARGVSVASAAISCMTFGAMDPDR
jgi:1,4-dihydroxy-2-naphthoate octaprenyltransferase